MSLFRVTDGDSEIQSSQGTCPASDIIRCYSSLTRWVLQLRPDVSSGSDVSHGLWAHVGMLGAGGASQGSVL